jgi:hypothetical protein
MWIASDVHQKDGAETICEVLHEDSLPPGLAFETRANPRFCDSKTEINMLDTKD